MADTTFQQLHGNYYRSASKGLVYTGVSASAGIALIAPATGGGHPTLWNPSGSTYNLSLVRLELSYVSGANAPTAIEWASTLATGSAVAAGGPIITATLVNPVGVLGGALSNKGLWAPTVNTFTAAPTFLRPTGLSLFTGIGATATAPFTLRADYAGDFVIAPGTAISLCTQAATTTALFQVAVTWEEVAI